MPPSQLTAFTVMRADARTHGAIVSRRVIGAVLSLGHRHRASGAAVRNVTPPP